MQQVFLVIAPLFLIVLASAVVQRVKKLDDRWSSMLNALAIDVGFPALILSALARTRISWSEQADLIIANSLLILSVLGISYLVGRIAGIKRRLLRPMVFCLAFGNVAYLGIPILTRVSGEGILATTSLIVAVYLFWIFTAGVAFLELTREKREAGAIVSSLLRSLMNPLLVSVVVGCIIAASGIALPLVVTDALTMISASVTPIVLILIGLFIGKAEAGTFRTWLPVGLFSLVKLFILPAGFMLALHLLGIAPQKHFLSIIEAAMPVAITPFALALSYDLDADFIARSIVVSTLLSIVSIPFWIGLF